VPVAGHARLGGWPTWSSKRRSRRPADRGAISQWRR